MSKHRRWIFYLALAAIALLGMLALLRSTPYGMGLVNDSATYIEGASNIIKGGGYVRISGGGEIKPITHFPPLFSLLLAGLGLVGVDLLQAARWMITILFGIAIYLVGLSVFKISRSPWFALFGAFLLAISDVHLGVYSFALSEPLFIALMLSAFLCLAEAFDRDHWVWPMLAGILLSLAYLTRYAGVSLFITSLLVLLVIPHREKLKRVGILLAGALPPVLIWHAYSLLASGAGSVGNRQFAWHPPSGSTLFEGMKNLLTWIAPHDLLASGAIWGRALSLLSIVLLPALLAWLIWMLVERISAVREDEACSAGSLLAFTQGLHVLVYLAFLIISLTLFDASTPLNDRILSVIYISEMILFASALAWVWEQLKGRKVILRWALGVICVVLAAFSVKDGYAAMTQLGREGQGFAHRGISGSPAIRTIQQMPPTVIYSNKPGAIFLLTGKSAYVTPTPTDPVTGKGRSAYQEDLHLMQQRVRAGEAILVLFGLRYSAEEDEVSLYKDLSDDLVIQVDYGDIVIFGASP